MRNMSFSLTTEQFLDGSKTCTRRLGWGHLKPGDRVRAVRKAMGLKKGEKVEVLGEFEVVSKRREELRAITDADVKREGFPGLGRLGFIGMFCKHMGCDPSTLVNRIEYRKVADHE